MKFKKVLSVLSLLAAFAVTACNGAAASEEPASEQPAGTSQVAPSSQAGGNSQGQPSSQAGGTSQAPSSSQTPSSSKHTHSWDNGTVTTPATCEQPGVKTYKCSGCNETKTEAIPAGHTWGTAEEIAAAGEAPEVAYTKAVCSADNALKVQFKALDGKINPGSNKSGTPAGFMKLSSNGNKITWKFTLAGDKDYAGMLYQVGAMDAFTSNTTKTYANTSSSNSSTKDMVKGNFEVKVNGVAIDKAAMMDVTFEEMTAGGADSSALGDNYSPVAQCQIGQTLLKAGENEITYERLGSYNLVISDIVFIGKEHVHTWDAGSETKAPTHDEEGEKTYTCAECGATKKEATAPAGHNWGAATEIAAADGNVAYSMFQCADDATQKIEFAALDGTFADGSKNKSGTEEGYMKLNSNGNKISWKINIAGEKLFAGKLYQLGFMDAFSSNTTKSYANTNSSDASVKDMVRGNFEVKVNGVAVDKSAYMDINFVELTKWGDDTVFAADKNYSPLTLAPIGEVVLQPGVNEFSYERLGSFNFAISKLVFIGESFEHTHHAAADWSKDADGHWHACDAANCPVEGGYHMDAAAHTWNDGVETKAATHNEFGEKTYTCTVCGQTKVENIAKVAHEWVDGATVQNADETPKNVIKMSCACGKVAAKMAVNDYASAQFDSDSDNQPNSVRPSQSKDITWNIVAEKAGKYTITLDMLCAKNGNQKMSSRGFKVKVGETQVTTYDYGTATCDSLGMTASVSVKVVLAEGVDLAEGVNAISLSCSGYRLIYTGYLMIAEN